MNEEKGSYYCLIDSLDFEFMSFSYDYIDYI